MTLDLSQYQAASPYPTPRNVRPDPQLMAKLMEGYSGEASELTTSLLYAYQSVKCNNKYAKISESIRGIFYVETLHMEMLGNCIIKLGGDPQYILKLRERSINWQSSFVTYENSPAQMLISNVQSEKNTAAFYEETSKSTNQPDIAKLLTRIAEDERLHVQIFSNLHKRFFARSGRN